MIQVMYSVQRQPRYDMSMKPPMKGASKGLHRYQLTNKNIGVTLQISPTEDCHGEDRDCEASLPIVAVILSVTC